MKNLTVLVDMDDTIECLTDAWLDWLNAKYETHVEKDDLHSWDFAAAFPALTPEQVFEPLLRDEFWDGVKPKPWAFETLCRLRAEGHEIYVVTNSAYETLKAKMEKVLFRYYPFLDWDHVIVAAKKQMVRGDVMIDDAPHNLEGFNGLKILISAPHNRSYDAELNGIFRTDDWQFVYRIVSAYARGRYK